MAGGGGGTTGGGGRRIGEAVSSSAPAGDAALARDAAFAAFEVAARVGSPGPKIRNPVDVRI